MNETIKSAYVSKAAEKLNQGMAKIREKQSPTKEDITYLFERLIGYAMAYEQTCESDTIQTYDDALCERIALMYLAFLKTRCMRFSKNNNCDYIDALYKAHTEVMFRPFFADFLSRLSLQTDIIQLANYLFFYFEGGTDL